MNFYYERYRYLRKKWSIDVCRVPIHIKSGTDAIDVYKRIHECNQANQEESFCEEKSLIENVILDDGLIFAQGEKEKLNDDHGMVYCSLLLMNAYLDKAIIFSKDLSYSETLFPEKYYEKKNVGKVEENVIKKEVVEELVADKNDKKMIQVEVISPTPTSTPSPAPTLIPEIVKEIQIEKVEENVESLKGSGAE